MSEKCMFRPSGVYPAMMTPFDEKGRVFEKELRRLTSWLIGQGVNGLCPLGTVGEFIHLNMKEKQGVAKTVVDEADGRVPVISGTTESCYSISVQLITQVREAGCHGALIGPPYYLPATQEIIEAHFEEICRAVPDFPVIIYNIPLFSTPISYDVVKRLSRLKNVVGMKDSSGSMVDLLHFMDKIRIAGEELNIMIGREEMFFPSLMVGAKGSITGTASVVPELMVEIYSAWERNDYERALKVQFSILYLIRAMFAIPFPLGFKAALECRGFYMGEPKLKLSSSEHYNYSKVKSRIFKILSQLLGEKMHV